MARLNHHEVAAGRSSWSETLVPEMLNPRLSVLAIFAPLLKPPPTTDLFLPRNTAPEHEKSAQVTEVEPKLAGRSESDLEEGSGWLNRAASIPSLVKTDAPDRLDIRNCYIAAVIASWIIGIVALVLGLVIFQQVQPLPNFLKGKIVSIGVTERRYTPVQRRYTPSHFAFAATQWTSLLFLLVINIIITALLDAHGRIRSTALRWSLVAEGSPLKYNTNSHLFSSSRSFGPCHWSINILIGITIFMSYGATSSLLANIQVEGEITGRTFTRTFEGPKYGVDVCGFALVVLGISLLLQDCISTWTLVVRLKSIKTWSSDPVVTAGVLTATKPRSKRCNVLDNRENTQYNDRMSAHQQVRLVRVCGWALWALFVLTVVAIVIVVTEAAHREPKTLNMDWVQSQANSKDISSIWQYYGLVYGSFPATAGVNTWASVIVQSCLQGLLTAGLLGADVIFSFLNDEKSWQDSFDAFAASESMTILKSKERAFKWLSVLLFAAKSGIQWIFGSIMMFDIYYTIALIPLVVLSGVALLIVVWVETLARKRPRRSAPTAYGEMNLLMELIQYAENQRRF